MNNVNIAFHNVEKNFYDIKALKKVDFQFGSGEIFGLLGPSGAGKTTIIKILTGQLTQDNGTILINGSDQPGSGDISYRDFGVTLDQLGLYERLSCYDNLSMFAEIFRVPKSDIDHVLKKVGLTEAKKRPVHKLSKGMKQRLAFARAVLHRPRVLILDEPTGALDPATAYRIHELIEEQRERGAAILLTTHNMEEAEKLCDHIALLHEGVIVEKGSPQQICRKYNHLKQIDLVLKDGKILNVPCNKHSAQMIYKYLESEQIVSIHSSEPNLQSVFMELTGKKLEVMQ